MKPTVTSALFATIFVIPMLAIIGIGEAGADPSPACSSSMKYGTINQQTGVQVGRKCVESDVTSTATPRPSPAQVPAVSVRPVVSPAGPRCDVILPMYVSPGDTRPVPPPQVLALSSPPSTACWRRIVLGTPGPSTTVLQEQATKLLPITQIGTTALSSGYTRPHIQTIFWAQTPPTLNLGTVTVLGQRTALKAELATAAWDFGDHTGTIHASTPGKAYVQGSCEQAAQCPDYFGHTYEIAGKVTVTLTVAWTVSYTTANTADPAAWTQLPTPLTTAASQAAVNIITNHAILIPNPDGG